MSDAAMETLGSELNAPGSAAGNRLFVDLGNGAGAIPVRAEAGKGSLIKSSYTAVSAFMVVLAAGGIFGMRKLGMSARSASAEVPIAIESAGPPKVESGRFEKLMSDLEAGDRPVQVDPSKLGRSPFELAGEKQTVAAETVKETEEQRLARLAEEARLKAEAERIRRIETTLAGLRLFGVVGGRTPAAKINDRIVRVGDEIGDLFKVKSIAARSVVLEADGTEYEITMGNTGQP
ncbi:MAG: hypothetical protein DYG94_03105 [Leptolyngbya sp. PLA3]|nr:MAG: hypothetical protein EDM82_11195 [Cyanobacteria bacterium CYA]MCE7967718.1 hypothetical protein [Leptolyngbya sp. PL-A3]